MIFLDASAAAKRYFPEHGSAKVTEVLSGSEPHCSLVLLRQSSKKAVLFVSADRQLLRAAQAEGLRVLDPETAP